MESGKQIGEDWRNEKAAVNIALSPDGKTVVSGDNRGAVRLWDIDTAKVIAKWTEHRTIVTSLCWSEDGQRVVSGSYDGVRVRDAETGKTILGPLECDGVRAALYSPDETMIAVGGWDSEAIGFINIWNANTGKLVITLELTGEVYCLAWPEDGKTLISGSFQGKIGIWSTITWQQIAVLTGHTSIVYDITISPNECILASASGDTTVRLWNLENGQLISSPLQHTNAVHCLSFSADGQVLATGCWDNNAYTWNVDAIVREAGLEVLLRNPRVGGKLLLDVRDSLLAPSHPVYHGALQIDVPPHPVQRLSNAQRLPPGFIDNSPDHVAV
jgi:WD40 repeat protein